MGQGISDVFYPDNPNRRRRAEQLRDDVRAYCNSYEEIKKARDDVLREIGPRLATLLKNEGYDTPAALDAKVQRILTGDGLAQYLRVKAQYDKNSELESTIFSITSYISVGSGVFLGGLALLGVITGGTAFALLGAVGVALAVVAAVLTLLAIFEGEKERSNLREVIDKLGPHRVEARRAQMLMQAISNWSRYIKQYLDSALVKKHPALVAEIWEGDFKADFAKSDYGPVVEWLVNHDRERGAWTNEDGNWRNMSSRKALSAVATVGAGITAGITGINSAMSLSMVSEEQVSMMPEEQAKVVLQREGEDQISMVVLEAARDMCIAEDEKGEKWAFMPETVTPKGVGVELSVNNCLFSIRRLATGEVLHDFGVVDFTPYA